MLPDTMPVIRVLWRKPDVWNVRKPLFKQQMAKLHLQVSELRHKPPCALFQGFVLSLWTLCEQPARAARNEGSEINAEDHHVPLQLKWIIEPSELAGVKREQLIPLVLFGPRGPKNVSAQ